MKQRRTRVTKAACSTREICHGWLCTHNYRNYRRLFEASHTHTHNKPSTWGSPWTESAGRTIHFVERRKRNGESRMQINKTCSEMLEFRTHLRLHDFAFSEMQTSFAPMRWEWWRETVCRCNTRITNKYTIFPPPPKIQYHNFNVYDIFRGIAECRLCAQTLLSLVFGASFVALAGI